MKRRLAIFVLILASATAAAADEAKPKAVFISREAIEVAARPFRTPRPDFEIDFGNVTYRNRYGQAHFAYLPFLPTLPYTFPSPSWNQIPNPFVLTGTPMASRH
jgi:hypothetical protein